MKINLTYFKKHLKTNYIKKIIIIFMSEKIKIIICRELYKFITQCQNVTAIFVYLSKGHSTSKHHL